MDNEGKEESRYPKIEPPKLESAIPPHLLHKLCEKEQWIFSQLSLISQQCSWLVDKTIIANSQQRELDRRVQYVEKFTGKWALIGAGCAVILTVLLSEGVKILAGKLFP